MLTQEEKDFMEFWESHREKDKTFKRALVVSGPIGFIFAFPILLMVLFHDWYKRMVPVTRGQMIIILIIVLSIAVFYTIFKQQRIWDRNEQHYKELKLRQQEDKDNSMTE